VNKWFEGRSRSFVGKITPPAKADEYTNKFLKIKYFADFDQIINVGRCTFFGVEYMRMLGKAQR